ncbi:MAG: hypothetical protein HZY73_11405 [Micropruina sp.]|nr:MAG: hypothetical protein HZY73_11405 [Micropruina sp.]
MDWDCTENGVIRERGVGATRTVSYYSAQGTLLATCPADARDFATRDLIPAGTPCPRPFSAAEVAASDAAAAQAALGTTRVSLDSKVRTAVAAGGTLDVDLGTTDTKWTPGTPLTLRGLKALTKADLQTATYGSLPAPLAELLAKLAPLLVDMAVAERRVGKLTVQVYDDAS